MNKIDLANSFIDAFYSFNRNALTKVLSNAIESQPNILYYQKWAECGNYIVLERQNYVVENDQVLCPIKVKDDLMSALEIDFHVTDTFHLTIIDGKICAVETSSDDPELYYKAKEWVAENRPELVEKACEGIWEGGATPCECINGMIVGFRDFIADRKSKM